MVGPENSAELADGRMLRLANPAIAQRQKSWRDRGSNAGLPALRRVHPFWTTPRSCEALENARRTDRRLAAWLISVVAISQ